MLITGIWKQSALTSSDLHILWAVSGEDEFNLQGLAVLRYLLDI